MAAEGRGRLRRGLAAAGGRRALAAAVIAVVAAAAIAVALAGGSGGASGPETSARATGTGTVERRTLAERLTATGTIGYAGETTVLARLAGTVTALPAIGDVIRRGERLYALAGEPVLLLYGSVPAYRTLAGGVSDGEDVEQLERNLAALGYEPGTVDEEFTYTTTEAVLAWEDSLGLEETGEVELGRVAFLRGPQRVTKLEATLGEALASVAAASGSAGGDGSNQMVAWHPEAEALAEVEESSEVTQQAAEEEEKQEREEEKQEREEERKREKREREAERKREKREREAERKREKREREKAERGQEPPLEQGGEEAALGSEEGSQSGGGGGEVAESEPEPEPSSIPVLRTSSTQRVVKVELEANQQSIAHRGQKVEVVLPGGAEVPGKVSRLAAVEAAAAEGGQGEEEAGVEATISVTGEHEIPALDGASVSVLFTQQVRKHVLSVPLTALIAIDGERFAVYASEGGARKRIVVTPGLAADGYVEVEGKGLRVGMTVETGE